jgi:catechol 2,3-dioxygenase-like lactoylglutathione lyase family enzyme
MAITFHSTVLITKNFDEMKRFYTDVMQQSIAFDFGNCVSFQCGLAIWALKDSYPITKALGAVPEPNVGAVEVCFETEDFDADAAAVKTAGAPLMHDIAEENWGQLTLRFYDPDKNIVELGESMPCFCRRLHGAGLSVGAVAEKTGISIETVADYLGV